MGWSNSHLYEIRARDVRWGDPDPDGGDGPLDARKVRLVDVIEDVGVKTLRYLYDFGDGWDHTIKIERVTDAVPGAAYPRLVEAAGRCPPEDVGGPWGYAGFLEAITNPKHERHLELMDWVGTTSIPMPSTPTDSPTTSLHLPKNGRESRQADAHARPDPRCAVEGYSSPTSAARI
jgi:hypothetical protein